MADDLGPAGSPEPEGSKPPRWPLGAHTDLTHPGGPVQGRRPAGRRSLVRAALWLAALAILVLAAAVAVWLRPG